MAHINTGPGEYDFTASGIIIRLDRDVPQAFVHLHKKIGSLMQFGGHVEKAQDPLDAVLDEITQESGYSRNQLDILQPKDRLRRLTGAKLLPVSLGMNAHDFLGQGPEGHKHIDTPYAFVTQSGPIGRPEEGESEDLRWLSLLDILQLKENEMISTVKELIVFTLEICLVTWERVPLSEFTETKTPKTEIR